MKKIFTTALVFLFVTCGFAATTNFFKGYVITVKGDTLKGEIKASKNEIEHFTKVLIKISETEKKTLKADKVKEYSFNGQTFVSRQVDGEFSFMKQLSKGKVNLYEFQYEMQNGNNLIVKSEFYIEKEGVEPVRIKSGKFKKQLSEIFADNSSLVSEMEEKKYEFENIAELVNKYNTSAAAKN